MATSCDDGPAAPEAMSLSVAPSSVMLAAIGDTAVFTAALTDQYGDAFAGVVAWRTSRPSVFTVTGAGVVTAVANGEGVVTASFEGLSATADVVVAQQPSAIGVASGDGQAARQGLALAEAVAVEVTDARGAPVEDVTVVFAPAAGHGTADPGAAATNDDGIARTTWTLGDQPGPQSLVASVGGAGGPSVQISATALTPEETADSVRIVAGDQQRVLLGRTLPAPVAALVLDSAGAPVPGARVAFIPADGHGAADPDTAATNDDGVAQTTWTLGDQPGPQSLSASVARDDGPAAQAAATALTPEEAAASVEVVSGNQQQARQAATLPQPVAFRVLDHADNPVPGARVAFAPADGHGAADPDTAATNNAGVAQTTWTLGDQPGLQSLSASVARDDGPAAQAAAIALTPEEAAASIAVVSGDQQQARQAATLPQPVAFRVLDRAGSPVPGVRVAFAPADGHGAADPDTAGTNDDGVAQTTWTLGDQPGPQSLSASVARADGPAARAAATALTPEEAVASIAIVSGDQQRGPRGEALSDPVVVVVLDDAGVPIPGIPVSFDPAPDHGQAFPGSTRSSTTGRARTNWYLGEPLGPQTLVATAADGPSVAVTATAFERPVVNQPPQATSAVPTLLLQVGGTAVSIAANSHFSDPDGDALVFSVASGNPAVVQASVQQDAIVLHPASTGSAKIQFSAADGDGASASQAFWTTVLPAVDNSSYGIHVADFTERGVGANASFVQAVGRWEQAIASDLPNQLVRSDFVFDACLQRFSVHAEIDDLVAFATVRRIDGPGGTLAIAGPCAVRRPEDTGLPVFGYFYYDSADLDGMSAATLHDVTLHELGHVLGFGALWSGHLQSPSLSNGAGSDTHFSGSLARAAFDAAGGTAYAGGAKVPVDNRAVLGSSDIHWRQGVFGTELMDAFIYYNAANPLSAVTLQSLADLGYSVATSAADAWTYTASTPDAMAAAKRGEAVHMKNDVGTLPVLVLDANGRVVRTTRR